jgi:membrane protease YdiL (CAAX protease family)
MVPRSQATRADRLSIRPFRLFAAFYLSAFVTLVIAGFRDDAIRTLGYLLLFAVLALATHLLTGRDSERPRFGRRFPLQLGLCVGVILVTGIAGARFGSEDDSQPGGVAALYGTGAWQFAIEVCVVFFGLRMLGLRRRDLGLGASAPDSGRVAYLWVATALAFLARDVAHGLLSPLEATRDVLHNVFRNGCSEEFLFRAALFSRLRLVLSDEWALVAQAAVFALWHYGADVRAAQGNLVVTVCFMITVQGVFGYALGFLALRTRSIAAGSAFHAIADATDII